MARGTFAIILPVSAAVGGLFGWAEHLRGTANSQRLRRLALSPLLFTVDPASLVVTLPALTGAYALSGRGSQRARWTTGACALLPVPTFLITVAFLDDIRSLGTPRGTWMVVLLFSHLAVLTLASTIPRLRATGHPAADPGHQSTAGGGTDDGRPAGAGRGREE